MENRLEHLKTSRIYYLSFLEAMKTIKLLSENDINVMKMYVEKKSLGSDDDRRSQKLNRYKAEKENQNRIKYLQQIEVLIEQKIEQRLLWRRNEERKHHFNIEKCNKHKFRWYRDITASKYKDLTRKLTF